MKNAHSVHSVSFTDPEAFQVAVEPVAGSVRTRPQRGAKLHGRVRATRLQKIGFLAIDTDPMVACIDSAAGFYGVTITRDIPFEIANGSRTRTYNRDSAHLLTPDTNFDFRAPEGASILGTNFFVDNLHDHACRLNGGADTFHLPEDYKLSLATPAGSSLTRYLNYVWSELNHGGGILNSELAANEIEDGLIAALIWTMEDSCDDASHAKLDRSKARISLVEEYLLAHLCDPVSRTELAQLAGVSIRTLSRSFVKRHGMGPMAYLRQHRLESARMELLLAEPGEIAVSDVALQYGFAQPSKFTAAYKITFNETPSDTLLRR